jgi:hypothetical protein
MLFDKITVKITEVNIALAKVYGEFISKMED